MYSIVVCEVNAIHIFFKEKSFEILCINEHDIFSTTACKYCLDKCLRSKSDGSQTLYMSVLLYNYFFQNLLQYKKTLFASQKSYTFY